MHGRANRSLVTVDSPVERRVRFALDRLWSYSQVGLDTHVHMVDSIRRLLRPLKVRNGQSTEREDELLSSVCEAIAVLRDYLPILIISLPKPVQGHSGSA